MASKLRKIIFILSTALILLTTIAFSNQRLVKSSDKSGLGFLANVVGLDVAQYNVKVSRFVTPVHDPSARLLVDETEKYVLTSGEDKIDVIMEFRDNIVVWCKIYPIDGSPRFKWAFSDDDFASAKDFLLRLQEYSSVSCLSDMQRALDSVPNHKLDSETSIGEVTLTVKKTHYSSESKTVVFKWSYNCNGTENSHKAVSLTFEDGQFKFFVNNWDLFRIGSVEVIVSQAQAIQIVKERAMEKFSLLPTQIRENLAMVTLSMQDKGNYTLHPLWNVRLPLDKPYGAVGSIHALVWADTGHVSYLQGV